MRGSWNGAAWAAAPALSVSSFHPRGSDHRPRVEAKLLFDDDHLFVLFRVGDRYVRSVHTAYDSDTYKDSCVELFVQPGPGPGYFALEVNCGGAFSLRYIVNPTRTVNRFAEWATIDPSLAATIRVAHSMPAVVTPEIADPVEWRVEVSWPFAVLDPYCGAVRPVAGRAWRGNLFKCGDETSRPHWASWAPVGDALNFHQPACFGTLIFGA